eukprot:XP_003977688.1 PREDICTED: transmembrane channel-like protein 4 [Takifugu rubripes]
MNEARRRGPTQPSGPAEVISDGYLGDRRPSSQASNPRCPQFDWGSAPTGDEEGPQDLRGRPLSMSLKRAVWCSKLRVPAVSKGESWKRKRTKLLRKLREGTREFLYLFSPWRKALQLIAGNFGGGVQSFFVLLRFLVLLNFFSFLLIAGFVLVPSIVFSSEGSDSVNVSGLGECTDYNPNPQGLVPFYSYVLDVLLGTGFVELSYLFYGFYKNTLVQGTNFYNIPLAYIFTAVFYIAFCLICIVARLGTTARVVVATGGGSSGNYSMIAFASWDYGSLGEKETKLKQKNILYRLQVDLEEERLKKQAAALTLKQKIILYSLRVILFFLALGLIIAALVGIFMATQFSQERSGQEGILGLIIQYLPSIVITAGNFVVPMLCDQISLLERYSPSLTIILALMRAVFLRLFGLCVLLFTLWSQVTCSGNPEEDDCRLCQYNHKLYPCWETRVGQEMYKLTVFDLLVTIATLVLVEFPRRMLVDNWSNKLVQKLGRQEFVVPANVLVLVYGQTVVWTGALFCPLLPLINTVKFIILFYCKKITLFCNCRPALRTFRSTTSTFFFLVVLLFGWGLATAVMTYSLAAIRPSLSCGPFRFFTNMWLIVPTTFHTLPDTTKEFLFFIGSQAFSIPLFILLCVVLCYFIALASVYGKTVGLLRAQLKLEGRDKQFLVKQIEVLSEHL